MNPNSLPPKQPRKFHSEAEYRLWQYEISAQFRKPEHGKGLVSQLVNSVRSWLF